MSHSVVPAFELRDLTKRFGDVVALDHVTVSVPSGSVVGLIGKNGSGKTTMICHVVGLLLPTSGECITLDRPARELGDAELARAELELPLRRCSSPFAPGTHHTSTVCIRCE
ncbi:MAG: ATP-binding cassette domain-containing protein [Longimicrobiales bacterium]